MTRLVAGIALLAFLSPTTAAIAQRAKLTEETLVPSELFPDKDKRRIGYRDGLEVIYFQSEQGHVWKLIEPIVTYTPTPTPTPEVIEGQITPTPSPTPTPEPTPPPLEPTEHEEQFTAQVGLVRPTVVTLIFTESTDAAQAMIDDFVAMKKDEETRHKNLAVFKLEKYPTVGRSAWIYNREFNLGRKSGGMRRASGIVMRKGNIFVHVDARKGLRDGVFDERYDSLEKRVKSVTSYLLRKL